MYSWRWVLRHEFARLLKFIVFLFIFAVGMTGCGPGKEVAEAPPFILRTDQPDQPTGSVPERKRVALVMKTLTNPFFIDMEKGARQAEKEFGVQLIVKTAAQETSIEQQIEIVESLIKAEVDAIVIAPGDSTGLIPVLKKAQDAGITIINIDNRLDPVVSRAMGLLNVPFISVNNEQGAYLSAKYISDQVKTPTKAAILEGIRTAQNGIDRKNGALRAFAENPNITVVAVETAHWKIDEGYDVSRALFDRYPDIGLIFCANDMMALGAIQYLDETGRKQVLVAAYDALDEARQAIKDGKLAVTIDQQAARQGYLGVKYAVDSFAGKAPPEETLIDVIVVSRDTLQ
jgi:ribose transport system substrate-binding protein